MTSTSGRESDPERPFVAVEFPDWLLDVFTAGHSDWSLVLFRVELSDWLLYVSAVKLPEAAAF